MSLEDKMDRITILLERTIILLEKTIQKMEERDAMLEQGKTCVNSIHQILKGEVPIRIPPIAIELDEETQFD